MRNRPMIDPQPSKPCPVCSRPSETDFRPFCSRRCADVDLQRWFSGRYAIPGKPLDDEDGEGDS
jgi:endogenous inhibitor of DNA gyrase (YacG/DUF329 family)